MDIKTGITNYPPKDAHSVQHRLLHYPVKLALINNLVNQLQNMSFEEADLQTLYY